MENRKLTPLFNVTHHDNSTQARAGELVTPHGVIQTPVFMPVGTQGTVKTLGAHDIQSLDYKIMLGNTYHLYLRPGLETLKDAGGLHEFMAWNGSILTDSGGYQVLSLATRRKMSEDGVEFSSHVDGARHQLTPEVTTNFQMEIGSDIAMCLDDCPPYPSLEKDAESSMEQTLRWAARCKTTYEAWLKQSGQNTNGASSRQLLFGITQGAGFPELRKTSSKRTVDIGFPGYAVGGLGVGEPPELTWPLLEASLAPLPEEAPHYLMGFGKPEDIWEGVERGVDMFDCVLPTRNGRNGQAFTSVGRLNLLNARFKNDFGPLDPNENHPVVGRYSRAYLCHLFRAGELLAPRLVTLHNLWFMISLIKTIRKAIIDGNFREEKEKFLSRYQAGNRAGASHR